MHLHFYACTFVKSFTHYSASYFTLMGHSFNSEAKMGTRYMRWAGYANKKKNKNCNLAALHENVTLCTGLAKA